MSGEEHSKVGHVITVALDPSRWLGDKLAAFTRPVAATICKSRTRVITRRKTEGSNNK